MRVDEIVNKLYIARHRRVKNTYLVYIIILTEFHVKVILNENKIKNSVKVS